VNAVDLCCVIDGDADSGRGAIVLVHGSWTDHASWQALRPLLAQDHVVVAYDRRGHSRSGPVDGRGTRRVHEDDLIEIIERLGRGPVDLVGNSYGGSIVLGVAARRPDLVRSVNAHEPPLVGLVDSSDGSAGALVDTIAAVLAVTADVELTVRAGNVEAGLRRFVEDLALGPGMWELLPQGLCSAMVANAPSFLEMLEDPDWGAVPAVGDDVPLLLTDGDASPPWLLATTEAIASRHPHGDRHTLAGAGHAPHLTHPVEYAATVRRFVAKAVDSELGTGGR
jgi:pimeloyl-ACP methyl ester carboxylesterase